MMVKDTGYEFYEPMIAILGTVYTLQKRLDKNSGLKSNYKEKKEDLAKSYVLPVKLHDPQLRSAREWNLTHHPFRNPN